MALSRNAEHALFGLGVVASAIAAAAIPLIVGRYKALFASFGAELPNLTRWFVDFSNLFLLLPAVVAFAYFFWPVRSMRAVAAAAIGVGSLAVFVPLAMFAMQYPVMMLGGVV